MADVDVTMPTQEETTARGGKRAKGAAAAATAEETSEQFIARSPKTTAAAEGDKTTGSSRRKGVAQKTPASAGSLLASKKAALAAAKAAKTAEAAPADAAATASSKKTATSKAKNALPAVGGAKSKKAADPTVGVSDKKIHKPHRFRPGTRALIEIRRAQKSTELMFRKLPFRRWVRELTPQLAKEVGIKNPDDVRFQRSAMECLQEAVEAAGVTLMEGVNHMALHARRQTIYPRDFHRLLFLLRDMGVATPFIKKSGAIHEGGAVVKRRAPAKKN